MTSGFNNYEGVYWVFTQVCNDNCDHCYNLSSPEGARISEEECLAIVGNLPDMVGQVMLSGGEPLTERKKLNLILDALNGKYNRGTRLMLQTNGDLLTEEILDELISKNVSRFDIASYDRYHKAAGNHIEELGELFDSRGVKLENDPLHHDRGPLSWGYWGANEDFWLGGNWARGRALQKKLWKKDPNHNFCALHSGAKGFLGGTDQPQEVTIQLWKISPCCPGTKFPLGDARKEKVSDVLQHVSKSRVFRRLNEGDPFTMGESLGVTKEFATARTASRQNVCLWCDEFFERYRDRIEY